MEMSILRYNKFDYAYARYGDADAPVIVLVMGLGMSSSLWPKSFIVSLVRKGFQVVTIDNRDSGRSTRFDEVKPHTREILSAVVRSALRMKVQNVYALEDMAFDIERVLNELGVRRAHVLGASMGGMIAQSLAMQCPNRVATLCSLSSASGNFFTGFGNVSVVASLLFGAQRFGSDEEKREYFRRFFTKIAGPVFPPTEEEISVVLGKLEGMNYDVYAQRRQLLAILASGDRRQALRQIRVPTLVIHGSEDPLLPVRAGRECASLIKDARYVEIKGMGHVMTHSLIEPLSAYVAEHCLTHPA